MKILIIARDPWREDNSFGNSFNNIFKDLPDTELAQICCGPGLPQTKTLSKFYYINEKSLIKNLLNPKNPSALNIDLEKDKIEEENLEENDKNVHQMKFFQKNRLRIFFFIREIIWKISRWKSKDLEKFVKDFNPDLIFVQLTVWPFVNNVALYTQKISGAKMLSYMSDDNYTLKQFSLDPSYWIYRLIQRVFVKKVIKKSEIFYVISEKQKKEYDKIFNIESKILFKGGNFDGDFMHQNTENNNIELLFTGNIGIGRHKNLALIGEALEEVNKNSGRKFFLTIFTNTPLTEKIIKIFSKYKYVKLNPAITFEEVIKEQEKSDILVHVESFDLQQKLMVRHSFSTKLVDYFQAAKCILAVGPKDVASMEYLKDNNVGIVCNSKQELIEKLQQIQKNPELIKQLAEASWNCGKQNHQITEIRESITKDFKNTIAR